MNVGGKIKKIRKMAGMTQEELAKKMNVSRQTILLISGLFFLMIGALAALFIEALQNTTESIAYILYRYIAVGQYSSAPVNYGRLIESDEEEYQKIVEEYGESQVIHFSYGADGCVNEIEF